MTFIDFQSLMANFGNGIITNALYDTIKSLIMSSNTKEELAKKIDSALHLHNVNVNAESIITLLASNGFITIEGSHIKSNLSITMGSFNNGELLFGNNSKSETNKTSIDTGFNSFIKMSGNAKIVQHEDGSIRFYT
jgi:macrodomain Ter protein organizer (MatP/YcbG family)